jgi:DNA-binding Lrp family transcriptional regulator
MLICFVLIKAKPGSEFRVLKKLENEPEIKEVYMIFGKYDFLVKISAKDIESIDHIIIKKIRLISGILDTITLHELKMK